jgi:uncharacterized integral membrane protein (TIGR00698 family)
MPQTQSLLEPWRSRVGGVLLTAALAAVAVLVAGLSGTGLTGVPGVKILGALGWALILGIAWRSFVGLPSGFRAGVSYSAKTILRLGIVLLGVRLNFQNIASSGALILALDAVIVLIGILAVERMGKLMGFSRGLRLTLAFGTGICGASAAVAAGGVANADDEEVSIAVGTVSLLGTLGVLGYIVLREPLGLNAQQYGLLTGSTLQEVGQVIAAGTAGGDAALDTATLTKLTRVALLAPALLIASSVLRLRDSRGDAGATATERPPVLPAFLLGFLAVGVVNSLGVLPASVSSLAQQLSIVLTTMAMAGIGLGVDLRAVRRVGARAMLLGSLGFGLLVVIAASVTALFVR